MEQEYKKIFDEYILNTEYKVPIEPKRVLVCLMTQEIQKIICSDISSDHSIFITSWSLKHIYDRHFYDKNAMDDFYLIFNNLPSIVAEPDALYENPPGKRGDFLLIKRIGGKSCLCSMEISEEQKEIAIVSASITGEKYLKNFTLLWSREDG